MTVAKFGFFLLFGLGWVCYAGLATQRNQFYAIYANFCEKSQNRAEKLKIAGVMFLFYAIKL